MRTLLREMHRAARTVPLEIRTRWHAWRAVRHHDLRRRHRDALADCMSEVRRELAAR